MGDTDDDSSYPPKHYSSYNASLRSRRPTRNPNFQSYREDEIDEDNGYEDEELDDQNDGGNHEFGNQDEDDDDDEDDYQQNGYAGRGYEPNDESKRRQKKRRLESLVSQYEFAPRVNANLQKPSFSARDSPADWTENASFVLLEVWGDRFVQLGRKSLRSEDWVDVAEKVSEMCKVERTHAQCRNRLDTLKKKYKKEKAKMEEMGAYYGKWVFFKKMDMLLNSSPRQQSALACGVDSGEYVFMNPKVYLSRSNALDEMMDSPGESDSDGDDSDGLPPKRRGEEDDGSSFRLLADSIQKFGAIYEKIEDSKRQQMLDLERMRMEFHTELELQKKQILERAQAEIAKIRQGDDDDDDDDETDTDESAGNVSG